MIAIEMRFPAGRYHATPWDRHVNEGLVEWPPSPWRILRMILATWHAKARFEIDEATVRRLVGALAGACPVYRLPRAAAAHTRHYMPPYKGNRTRVFDAFLHVSAGEPLTVSWNDVRLEAPDRTALSLLLERTGYFGRAESWADLTLGGSVPPEQAQAFPVRSEGASEDAGELVRVLCPETEASYASWRHEAGDQLRDARLESKRKRAMDKGRDPSREKLTARELAAIEKSLPADLFEALQTETTDLRREGWNRPPGTRWIDYWRRECARPGTTPPPARRRHRQPTVARLAVASAVPPRLTEAVSVADRIRTALLSRSDGAAVFSGRSSDGSLASGHRHVHILPEANGAGGFVTHVTLFARMGFDAAARRALDGLRMVWGRGGHDLQLVLLGLGEPEDFSGIDVRAGHCPIFAPSPVWVSRTPFVSTRHPKSRRDGKPKLDEEGLQIGSPEHDLRRLLRMKGYPRLEQVERTPATTLGGRRTRWLEFRSHRHGGHGRRSQGPACGFRIRFQEAVRGPLVVGYGSHFGLGLFLPEGVFD